MTANVDWDEVRGLLDDLYAASGRLKEVFPGRKFNCECLGSNLGWTTVKTHFVPYESQRGAGVHQ